MTAAVHRDIVNGTPVVARSTPKKQQHYHIMFPGRPAMFEKKETEAQSIVDEI